MKRMVRYSLLCSFILAVLVCADVHAQRVEDRLRGKKINGVVKEPGASYFIVVGDWGRNGNGDEQAVADWMGIAADQVNARFVISTGDNFYCCGVASTEDYQWISSFENVFRSHSLQIPWFVTLGNHDYQGNVEAQIVYSTRSQRWRMPSRYFTKSLLGMRFVFIDTSPFIRKYYPGYENYPSLHKQDTTAQRIWIDSVLAVSPERTKIVIGHHPLYSVGEHGGEADMIRALEPVLKRHGVLVYFAGHDHSLQSLRSPSGKTFHLISGGGAEFTPVVPDGRLTRYAKATTGFMIVESTGDVLKVYFIDSKGKLIYTESIHK
jgi:tartrate-resistant acid phosphatase type 5